MAVFLCALVACLAWAGGARAIVNGVDAEAGRYPWLVRFNFSNDGVNDWYPRLCSGVLVAPDVVATTASCDIRAPGKAVVSINGGAESRRVVAVVTHRKWQWWTTPLSGSNLALMLLDRPSSFDPVKLLSPPARAPKDLTAIGYGVTAPMSTEEAWSVRWSSDAATTDAAWSRVAGRLQEANLTQRQCDSFGKHNDVYGGLPLDIVCAGGKVGTPVQRTACLGDDGGPLFVKGHNASEDVVVALLSLAGQCGTPVPNAWTSVRWYSGWIQSTMRALVRLRSSTARRKAIKASIRAYYDATAKSLPTHWYNWKEGCPAPRSEGLYRRVESKVFETAGLVAGSFALNDLIYEAMKSVVVNCVV